MSQKTDKCPVCLKPREKEGSGFVTQFIELCNCAELAGAPTEQVVRCLACSKQIGAGREGSFTQWIFRHNLCQCQTPLPDTEAGPGSQETPGDERGFGAEQRLTVDPESFPLDRFTPLEILGRGASGTVYRAVDETLGKIVAVKTLHSLNAEQLISFQSEARSTSRLRHPNIIEVLDFGATDGRAPYMVMEFVPGLNAADWLLSYGTMSEGLAASIMAQVCDALAWAHERNIYHRDVKPSNILLVDDESSDIPAVRLIDFGMVKVREATGSTTEYQGATLAGTPAYLPPDNVTGKGFDARSEIYSVGCTLFELLAGRPPFVGETALETIGMHVNQPVPSVMEIEPDSHVSDEMEQILATCLEKDPERRFQTMKELQEALGELIVEEIQQPESAGDKHSAEKTTEQSPGPLRSPLVITLFAAGVVFVVARSLFLATTSDGRHEKKLPPVSSQDASKEMASIFQTLRFDKSRNRETINIYMEDLTEPAAIKTLRQLTVPRSVSLNECKVSRQSLEALEGLSLRKLSLRGCVIPDRKLLETLSDFHDLDRLLLSLDVSSRAPLDIRFPEKLSKLELFYFPISKNSWRRLAGLSRLSNLDLVGVNLAPDLFKPASSFREMKFVRLIACKGLDQAMLTRIADLSGLTTLELRHSTGTVSSFLPILRLKKLRILQLETVRDIDDLVRRLPQLPHLKRLSLGPVPVSTLQLLERVRTLEVLAVTNVTVSDIAVLERLKLKSLILVFDSKGRWTSAGSPLSRDALGRLAAKDGLVNLKIVNRTKHPLDEKVVRTLQYSSKSCKIEVMDDSEEDYWPGITRKEQIEG